MILVVKLITVFIGTLIISRSIVDFLKKSNSNIIIYPQIVFYFFMYIPIILDIIVGRPEYPSLYYGFIKTGDKLLVESVYCLIIVYILIMLRYFQKKHVYKLDFKLDGRYADILFIATIFILVIYCIYILANQDIRTAVLSYDMRNYRTDYTANVKNFGFVIIVTVLGILLLENNTKKLLLKLVMFMPFILFAFMLNGKRAIVLMFFSGIVFIITLKRMFKRKITYLIMLFLIAACAITFQKIYENKFFDDSINSFEESYSSFRVNYGRDDTLKMVIYSELNPNEMKILDYRGQTLVYYLTFFVKREVWTSKPYPYAVNFTNAMIGVPGSEYLGWEMTTSIFDELFSNLGWIGIIISPFLFNLFCRTIVLRSSGLIGKAILLLGILLSVLVIAVQVSAFLIFFLLLIVLLVIKKIGMKLEVVNT